MHTCNQIYNRIWFECKNAFIVFQFIIQTFILQLKLQIKTLAEDPDTVQSDCLKVLYRVSRVKMSPLCQIWQYPVSTWSTSGWSWEKPFIGCCTHGMSTTAYKWLFPTPPRSASGRHWVLSDLAEGGHLHSRHPVVGKNFVVCMHFFLILLCLQLLRRLTFFWILCVLIIIL